MREVATRAALEDTGFGPADTAPFLQALLAGRRAAHLVSDAMVDTLAVAGTVLECRAAVARLAEAGLATPIAVLLHGPPIGGQIAALCATLAPASRGIVAPARTS